MDTERRRLNDGLSAYITRDEDGENRHISGYAAVYNSLSEDLGGFYEVLEQGSFDEVMQTKPDVRALSQHDTVKVLGRTSAETLTLEADSRGLKMDIALPDTTYAADLYESVRRGDISGASFGFRVGFDDYIFDWDADDLGLPVRRIKTIRELIEVSVVTFPAYQGTEVSAEVRSLLKRPKPAMRKLNQRNRELFILGV